MFIVSTDRKHIINLDHVQEINIHNTEKSKIMATFASGKPIQIGQYNAPQEAAESFSDLIDRMEAALDTAANNAGCDFCSKSWSECKTQPNTEVFVCDFTINDDYLI